MMNSMLFSPSAALILVTLMFFTIYHSSVRSFQLGSKVHWTKTSSSPRHYRMSSLSSTAKEQQGHEVRGSQRVEMDAEEAELQKRFYEHQERAPKLGFATDVRTLIQYNHGYAVMSTNSKS